MQNNKIKYLLLSAISAAILSGCATTAPSDLPSNITTKPVNAGQAVDNIRFEYTAKQPIDFSYVKLCVAQNIKYDSVRLSDSSASFVGSYTGNYYNIAKSTTEQARDSIILVDDSKGFIIARGTTQPFSANLGVSRIARFIISIETDGNKLSMLLDNVEQAQLNTGAAQNSGFSTVGTWFGSGFDYAYSAITATKDSLTSCLAQRGF